MNGLPAMRILQRILLLGAMLAMTPPVVAAGAAVSAVAPPHGPMLMLYVSLPLWSAGASRIYGLRLEQISIHPLVQSGTFSVIAPPRSLIDLQWRRDADWRVEFGRRVTWDMQRREFGLSGHQHAMSAALIATPR
jgi:hypothetical protein